MFFYLQGQIKIDVFVNQYFVQFFVFAQVIAGAYFAFSRVFKNKIFLNLILIVYILFSFLGLYYMYQPGGTTHRESTYFSDEFIINSRTWFIFQSLAIPAMILVVFDFGRLFWQRFIQKRIKTNKYFLANLAYFLIV